MGITRRTVAWRCQAGAMPGRQFAGQWWVDAGAVPALRIALGDPTGQPPPKLAGLTAGGRETLTGRLELVRQIAADLMEKPAGITVTEWLARWRAWRIEQPGGADCPSVRTLYRLLSAYRAGGAAALADRRRARREVRPAWSPEALEAVLQFWRTEHRRSVAVCYEMAAGLARSRGWTMPSLRTCQDRIRREASPALNAAGRDPRRFRDRMLPHIERDWSRVGAMEAWVADHRQLDILVPHLEVVRMRRGGREVVEERWQWHRPWLTMFLDARTWWPAAWAIRFESPTGNWVMSVFAAGVRQHGLPAWVYLDNGKDFRMHRFSGGRKRPARPGEEICDARHLAPLLAALGVESQFALPYNAKAKTVEPFFRLVSERFDRMFDTYCGRETRYKPEALKRIVGLRGAAEKHHREGLTLDSVRAAFDRWLTADYGLRECPVSASKPWPTVQAFERLRGEGWQCRRPAEEDLALLLMPSEAVCVRANGVWCAAHKAYYWHEALLPRVGGSGRDERRKVIYRYRDDDASLIYVFDAVTGEFLCAAAPTAGQGVHPRAEAGGDDEAALREAMQFRGRRRAWAQEALRAGRQQQHDVLIGLAAQGANHPAITAPPMPEPPTVIQFAPAVTPVAAAVAAEKRQADETAEQQRRFTAGEWYGKTGTDDISCNKVSPAEAALERIGQKGAQGD